MNRILLTDSYKVTQYKQYPKDIETVYSYFESRGGDFNVTTFFGLQYIIKEYLLKPITQEEIDEAKILLTAHFGSDKAFNLDGWQYIVDTYGGKLPVRIDAVQEGRTILTSNVLMTIENTDPKCFWLTNYLETLLVQVWYPTTVATISRACKQIILKYLEETGDPSGILFKLHDFGFRGVSSVESAGIGGVAHLTNFMGTDTLQALVVAQKYYNCDCAGFSIPASEHSTMTSWGKDNEVEAFENMLDQYKDFPIVACVSDSYDIYKACEQYWGTELKDKVMSRNGTLVIRPDSGDPKTVILKCLNILWDKFGGTTNDKGYKVLDSHVRLIQGDGVDLFGIEEILEAMKVAGWSADNIAFGMGGGLLQKLNRDTQKFAFKCSAIKRSGKWYDVYKDPVTSDFKKSKKGRLVLAGGKTFPVCVFEEPLVAGLYNELELVYKDGHLFRDQTLDEIREITNSGV